MTQDHQLPTRGAILIYDPGSVAKMRDILAAALAYADLLERIAGNPNIAAGLRAYADEAISATDAWIAAHPSMRGPQP